MICMNDDCIWCVCVSSFFLHFDRRYDKKKVNKRKSRCLPLGFTTAPEYYYYYTLNNDTFSVCPIFLYIKLDVVFLFLGFFWTLLHNQWPTPCQIELFYNLFFNLLPTFLYLWMKDMYFIDTQKGAKWMFIVVVEKYEEKSGSK